jgi:hypothetical protein
MLRTRSLPWRLQVLPVDRRSGVTAVVPKIVVSRRLQLAGRRHALITRRAFDGHSHHVVADDQPIAIPQPVRAFEAAFLAIEERAVGRDVVQHVAAVLITDLAVLARDGAAGIGQGPIEMPVAADIDAAHALDRNAQRTAVREACLVFDL